MRSSGWMESQLLTKGPYKWIYAFVLAYSIADVFCQHQIVVSGLALSTTYPLKVSRRDSSGDPVEELQSIWHIISTLTSMSSSICPAAIERCRDTLQAESFPD